MYEFDKRFGCQIFGQTLGEVWMSAVKAVLRKGSKSYDEGRERLALSNVRVKSATQELPDKIISEFGHQENLKAMLDLTFTEDVMRDIDVVKSFQIGAKSYHKRLIEGRLLEFVIERLGHIPESKKAVIVFPTVEDYKAILLNHGDDYLPCIVAIQFRLTSKGEQLILNTTFYARSMDVYQKGHGNLVSIAMLSEAVARGVCQKIKKVITLGFLDGIIADVHIYNEVLPRAKETVERYNNE